MLLLRLNYCKTQLIYRFKKKCWKI